VAAVNVCGIPVCQIAAGWRNFYGDSCSACSGSAFDPLPPSRCPV
jgi:hypothetical protein